MWAYFRAIWVVFLGLTLITIQTVHAQRPSAIPLPDSASHYNAALSNICSNDANLAQLRKDPVFKAREEQMNRQIMNAVGELAGDTITVPVVFHIINHDPNSISDGAILNALQDLNNAFSKSGGYAGGSGVDTKIRFCLAQKDPDGGNTTGITRTKSFFSTHLNKDNEDARLKKLIQWDPASYINIWFITSIDAEAYADFSCGTWFRLGVGGYATMPPGGGPLDGIVVTGFGPLLAHEMGHYLGLYHTFEGGCRNIDCETDGDRVCDTPPDASVRPSGGCGSPSNSCSSDTLSAYSNGFFPVDVPDQVSNFMDYGNNACSNQFTQGQADRMRAAIQTQRAGLLEARCVKPCVENIVAGFSRNNAYPVPGDNITFTNHSAGAANYEWLLDGVVVSTAANFSHTFNVAGKFKLTLKAYKTNVCFATYTDYILVNCGVTARFYTSKQTIASKENIYTDTILFKNNSYNGLSYQWLISNNQGMGEQVISTATDLNYMFPTPATYNVRLVATNGSCADTTAIYTVPVLDPTPDGAPFSVSISCSGQDKVKVNFCLADYGYAPLPKNTVVNFYDADPRSPGANKLSPAFKLPNEVPGGNCSACFTNTLDFVYRGQERIFIVYNDTGTAVPVVLPNTFFAEKSYANNFAISPPTRININTSICEGQSYLGYTKTGVYIDTLVAANGCDNIRTLNLTVKPVYKVTVTTSICEGENYAGHTASGTYVDVYPAQNGCDSTRTLHLTVKPVAKPTVSATICEGEDYGGHTTPGTFTDIFTGSNGCDSVRTLHLIVNPKKITTVNHIMCEGNEYLAGGRLQTATGVYYDTLDTYLGCDSVIVTNLTVNPLPLPDLGKDRGICIGDTLTLNPGIFSDYLWQDGSKNPDFKTQSVGLYSVTVSNVHGCVASDTMRVLGIDALPANFLPVDTTLCRGNILKVQVPGYIDYNWSTGDKRWFLDITATGVYRLVVTDRNGCSGSDSVDVVFDNNCIIIQIPNAFTPDNNGKNDVFIPFMSAPLPDYHMQVYNRWGQLLFETRDTEKGWDGDYQSKDQTAGTYVYVITFKDFDGKYVKKSGTVILVR
jgi:gliding motility-associated-like protein